MTQIQKVSSYLRIVCNIAMAWFILPPVVIWGFMNTRLSQLFLEGSSPIETPEGWIYLSQVKWTALTKSIAFGGNMLSIAPLLMGLFILKAIFRNYQRGAIFTTENARHYRSLAMIFFLNALLVVPVSRMLDVLAITLSNPPGHRYISINFGTPNLEILFYGLLGLVISWIMLEASKIQEDQQFTI